MPVKYIQRDDGKFDGSIGDGKDNIPGVSAVKAGPDLLRKQVPDNSDVKEAWEAFQANRPVATESIDLALFRVDESFPVPQANSLAKVAASIDAIEGGADTDEAVAVAIGVTPRQGAYYANAAGYLGLVVPRTAATPRQWELTAAGIQFLNANAETRANILGHVVSQIPEVDASLNDGVEIDELFTSKLGESTASRRAATMDSWLDTLTDTDRAQSELTLESDGVRERIDDGRAVAVRVKQEAARRAKIERPTASCQRCFMVLPATGICSNCDD